MWKKNSANKAKIDTLIGCNSIFHGDIHFSGGLHIDGEIRGNVFAEDFSDSVLTVGENGVVDGEVHVPEAIINGSVKGDIYASESLELVTNATVTGNVFYSLIKMTIGAKVNGKLICNAKQQVRLENDVNDEPEYIEDQGKIELAR